MKDKLFSNPLFLPEGSVRAMMALILILTACWLCGKAINVPTELWDSIQIIIAFYFGTKVTQKREEK